MITHEISNIVNVETNLKIFLMKRKFHKDYEYNA